MVSNKETKTSRIISFLIFFLFGCAGLSCGVWCLIPDQGWKLGPRAGSSAAVSVIPLRLHNQVGAGLRLERNWGFPGGSEGKESAFNAGDPGSIPGLGRSPGEGHGDPLHCSYLEGPTGGGAWWAAAHGVARPGMSEQRTLWLLSKKKSVHFLPLPRPSVH